MEKHNNVRLPDIEVRITAAAFDTLVIGWYASRNPNDAVEVIAYLTGAADIRAVVEILQDAIKVVRSNDWRPLVGLAPDFSQNEENPPF